MKIGLFSDIHLEHRDPTEAAEILCRIRETADGCDVIVNAGDTHEEFRVQYWVAKACLEILPLKPLPPYISVLGNHDYYYGDWRDDEIMVEQHGDGTKFLTGTMWTDFGGDAMCEFLSNIQISDFQAISGASSSLMKDQFEAFKKAVESEKPDVVVSHFAPSPQSIVEQWAGHALNNYFCPDMLGQLKHWPKLWLHGHIHNPVDYVATREVRGMENGTCRVVANPLGYPGETYQSVFEDYSVKVLEI